MEKLRPEDFESRPAHALAIALSNSAVLAKSMEKAAVSVHASAERILAVNAYVEEIVTKANGSRTKTIEIARQIELRLKSIKEFVESSANANLILESATKAIQEQRMLLESRNRQIAQQAQQIAEIKNIAEHLLAEMRRPWISRIFRD